MNEAASKLSQMRKRYVKTCEICETTFEGIAQARYCSNACRQKAKYRREKGKKSS